MLQLKKFHVKSAKFLRTAKQKKDFLKARCEVARFNHKDWDKQNNTKSIYKCI